MRRLVFVDLDDTLFQSEHKNPAADQPAAVDREGRPHSFLCERQAAFLAWLVRDATVVPVTGRNLDAFRRVVLTLGEWAICSFGGVILGPGDALDLEWQRRMSASAADSAAPMEALHRMVAEHAAAHEVDVRHRVICDAGLSLYLSVKHNTGSAAELARLAGVMAPAVPAEWTVHLNGNNLALLPPFLNKANAVAYFLERHAGADQPLTIGVGDSLTDLGFMALCDYIITPGGSQIHGAMSPCGATA
ncbi:MAG: hypothetical protein HQL63_15635 [Magnetococcales bacterium]|nr:hypothetical protein [Magnetococcales bacterium]